ncbi:MAG: diguanylate cyclase [Campylobacterales bacterium]|nr:diguanylate cyclase [Campylobacterales bacterium]
MEQKQNILVVDDEKSNIDIIINLFNKINGGELYNIIPVLSGEKALKAVEKKQIDLILLDIMMPDMDGYEVCKILKSKESTKNIPVLFITSSTDDDSIIEAYSIGAADYVTKPFKAVELLSRVKINLQLQQNFKQLEYYAYYDTMTNVYNRRKFFKLATKKFDTKKENLYGVMIDIDKFKNINDTYGHAVGDKVIKSVATHIKDSLDDEMILGRIGGEEFAIILNADSDEMIYNFIESIRKKIEHIEIFINQTDVVRCTISDGIAKYHDGMPTVDHLLQSADEALYEAKESGRNRTIFRINKGDIRC